MTLLEQSGEFVTGHAVMDQDHEVFLTLLNRLAAADSNAFPTLFQQLFEQTEQHFEWEHKLMQQHAFPATSEHKAEHQRVVGEFKQFKTRIDRGLIAFGRPFVADRLPQWFKLHVATMDYALVAHIGRQAALAGMADDSAS
ncbi:MAG: hemerythrin family protein [Methylococcales bacterium]|nr:hemerythrin family protein [Methylococcales bacterium]